MLPDICVIENIVEDNIMDSRLYRANYKGKWAVICGKDYQGLRRDLSAVH